MEASKKKTQVNEQRKNINKDKIYKFINTTIKFKSINE